MSECERIARLIGQGVRADPSARAGDQGHLRQSTDEAFGTRASTQTSWPMSWADERVRKDCTAPRPKVTATTARGAPTKRAGL